MNLFLDIEFERVFFLTLAFLIILVLAEVGHRRLYLPVEWTRKFVHMSCGFFIAFFPWIFSSEASIALVVVGLGFFFIAVRQRGALKSIYGIKRKSLGDAYYLVAIVILLLANPNPIFYSLSILTLTLSDSLAALVGSKYQQTTGIKKTHKSLEGSLTFFLSTFLLLYLSLLFLTTSEQGHSLLIAIDIALFISFVEAISFHGLDNLFIPLATYFLLSKLSLLSFSALAYELIGQIAIALGAQFLAWRKGINFKSAVVIQLFLYALFHQGGLFWLSLSLLLLMIFVYSLKHNPEWLEMIWLYGLVQWRNGKEFFSVLKRYYFQHRFRQADLALLLHYLFKNPYRISKQFLEKKRAKELYAYGETPLTSLEIIAKQAGLTEKDCLFELGCGRGRCCFWLRCFIGCHVVGIDHIPFFIDTANQVKKRCHLDLLEFRCQEIEKANFSGATALYLYGTCLDEVTIHALIAKFKLLPPGTKIITVSYPLTDYPNSSFLQLVTSLPVEFTWGTANVYVHHIHCYFS